MTATVSPVSPVSEPRDMTQQPAQRPDLVLRTSRVLLVASLTLWVVSLPFLADAKPAPYGLLQAAGPGLLLSILGVTAAFGMALRAGSVKDCAASVAAFVTVTRATASIIDPLPAYGWTYKHIGVADYISSTGHLSRGVDIYNSWPGFFSTAAWLSDLSGVSLENIARWFPFLVDLGLTLGVYAVSRAVGQSARVGLVAAFGMQVFNWVGQDYFSPQALGFFLALPAIALLFRSKTNPITAWLGIVLFLALTVTHQLTPFWLCGIAFLLAFTRQIRPRWIALVLVLIAVGYAAANYSVIAPYGIFTGFDPLSNAQTNTSTVGTAAQRLISTLGRAVSALLWLGAVLCAVIAKRRGEPVWARAIVAFTSFGLLAGENYGGEAIFRVLMYSIPGCMLFVAPVVERVITRSEARPRHLVLARLVRLSVAAVALIAVTFSLQAYYGAWFTNLVSRQDLSTESRLLDTASSNTVLMPLVSVSSARSTGGYVRFLKANPGFDDPLVLTPGVLGSSFREREVTRLTKALLAQNRPVYFFITDQMRRYSTFYGIFPPGAIDRLVANLKSSAQWTVAQQRSTITVFRLNRS